MELNSVIIFFSIILLVAILRLILMLIVRPSFDVKEIDLHQFKKIRGYIRMPSSQKVFSIFTLIIINILFIIFLAEFKNFKSVNGYYIYIFSSYIVSLLSFYHLYERGGENKK